MKNPPISPVNITSYSNETATKFIAVYGAGALGLSLTTKLRTPYHPVYIIALDTCAENLNIAKQNKQADHTIDTTKPLSKYDKEQIIKADIVIHAAPVGASKNVFAHIEGHANDEALIMDLCSTKKEVVDTARSILSPEKFSNYVPSHPMAGTQNSGPNAAKDVDYSGKAWPICINEQTSEHKVSEAIHLIKMLNAKIITDMSAEEHDVAAANISHFPQLMSSLVMHVLGDPDSMPEHQIAMSSTGLDSTRRLASSDPVMWTSIFMSNLKNSKKIIKAAHSFLTDFENALNIKDATEVHRLLSTAKNNNEQLTVNKSLNKH
jgi:prephenate dehydrogenase